MSKWQQDYLERIKQAQTTNQVLDALRQQTGILGFEYCAYGLQYPVGFGALKPLIVNNYPVAWQKRYVEQNYLSIDPTVRHGRRSTVPIVWDEPLLNESKAFWEDARSFGLNHGWTQSSMSMTGTRGLLTLARSNTPLTESELMHNECRLSWLTQVTHHCMTTLVSSRFLPAKKSDLSQRETDILRWTAEGKTAWEVSVIMGITERTVNFHIRNAVSKLSCVNKTSAVVRASLLGLLN